MKKIFFTISFLLLTYCAFSQIDTTSKINITLNESRCNCESFGAKLKQFRESKQVLPETMRLFLSSIASHYTKRKVSYTQSEYNAIENDHIELEEDLQVQILQVLRANERY